MPRTRKGKKGHATTGLPRREGVYFLSLELEGVRCFGPKQILDLSDGSGRPAPWTIILGNNGVGKTTLLRSLVWLVPDRFFRLQEERYAPKGFVGHSFLTPIAWRPFRHASERSKFGATLFRGDLGGREKGNTLPVVMDLVESGPGSISNTVPAAFSSLNCYGYGATRRMGAGTLTDHKDAGATDSLFLEDVPLRNAEEWLLQADYAAAKDSPGKKAAEDKRDRIKQLLLDLLPEVLDIRFVAGAKESSAARVEFETHYGWVGMRDLSLGYRTLIAWMVDLASRLFEQYPESPDPLAEPAVVLVDEIDLHLHPKWQRVLTSYLRERFPNTQFIVTAHSPLVVQGAEDANIAVLRREGDHVVIDNDVEAIRGWRVDQVLTSDLFGLESARPPRLDQLLAERTALLSKPRLTRQDKTRLQQLESDIGELPTGETKTERDAIALIERVADKLRAAKK